MLPYWRLSAYYFFYFGFVGAFSPYFALYLQAASLTATEIALLMSLMQLMRVLAPNMWSWLAERLAMRVAIVRLSALMSLVGFSGFFMTTEFAGLFAAMALMAFFWSAALPLIEGLAFSHLGAEGHRYGSIRAWGSVGFIVAVLALGQALDHVAIESVLWVTAAILAGVLACSFAIPESVPSQIARAAPSLRDTLRRPEVRALFGACFLMSAAHGAFYVFYSIYLVDEGYGKALVGWMWTLGVVAEIIVFMLMPRITRRFSLRGILLFSFACAVLRFALIGWGAGSLPVLLFAQVLHGATFGAYHAAAIAVVNLWFCGRLQSRGQALYGSISFGAGGMLGGLLSGYTWDAVGPEWTFTLGSVFALAGLVWLVRGWPAPRAGEATSS
ncbi:MFS transporter [Thauera linaloolentis]|uniref:Major facilitator superfamily protein n=1 Tax=Thauera linaloolentis (strain DSM 12138 / JCM 21573 / CCUG 41526 / CIP 105981 / IAM 15112 / NBRC 102519 / 47Lol) TaxID=1123367 RepID=N6YF70_THAL4|nr:MFS transporter [Thauera linaloolentis]ENO90170.1 major facilitator superfamily protein [Thauera linaloolentis 47Lol = DSM 12138]MCM8564693.1 MFS transporter [Thauera linaloolentis]